MKKSKLMRWQDGDSTEHVQLERAAMPNKFLSDKHGRPMFDEVLRVYISSPGNKNQTVSKIIERISQDDKGEKIYKRDSELKAKYAKQIEAWEGGEDQNLTGTPLTELRSLSVAEVENLYGQGIRTIEELAELPDTALSMGFRKWREHAQLFMKQSQDLAPLTELQRENEDLKAQIDELRESVEALTAPEKPKRGRPAKTEAA